MHFASTETTLISSPALLKRLTEEHQPSALRCVFSSGGPLPNDAANHSQQLFGDYPLEVFGSTETGGIAYRQQLSATQPWTLFPGVEAALNHENCLKLRSPTLMKTRGIKLQMNAISMIVFPSNYAVAPTESSKLKKSAFRWSKSRSV